MDLNKINNILERINNDNIKKITDNLYFFNKNYQINLLFKNILSQLIFDIKKLNKNKNIISQIIPNINNKKRNIEMIENTNKPSKKRRRVKRKYKSTSEKYSIIFNNPNNKWQDDKIFMVSIKSINDLFGDSGKPKFEFKRSFKKDFIITEVKNDKITTHFNIVGKKIKKEQILILYKKSD